MKTTYVIHCFEIHDVMEKLPFHHMVLVVLSFLTTYDLTLNFLKNLFALLARSTSPSFTNS
jgi:hypothetical protein